jgi:hypothetical protein
VAATARFEGGRWTLHRHEHLSWAVDWRAAFESSSGSLWFGSSVDSANLGREYVNGLMEYRHGRWIHHRPATPAAARTEPAPGVLATNSLPATALHFYGIGESSDGHVWAGLTLITHFNGVGWKIHPQENDLRIGTVESIFSSSGGDLWIGSRQRGVFRFDGRNWQRFHVADGLIANAIRSITQTTDGTVWAATDRGISQFDGRSWNPDALPAALNMPREGGSLKASLSGALWINRTSRMWNRRGRPRATLPDSNHEFWTVCYQLDRQAPETVLTLAPAEVGQPGNVTISWQGSDPWAETAASHLQFAYRLDGAPWSPYTTRQMHSFLSLRAGQHRFEVRARDHDLNVDSTPAAFAFVVKPPVWQQTWFLCLMSGLLAVIAWQALRLARRARRLREINTSLSTWTSNSNQH